MTRNDPTSIELGLLARDDDDGQFISVTLRSLFY